MKTYTKIDRYGKRGTQEILSEGSHVVVMEKLDGSNSSFGLVGGELKCFSRKQELSEDNGLRGFYQWVHANIDKEKLIEGDIYYGEWLVKHSIEYPKESYDNFYLFDIRRGFPDEFDTYENIKLQGAYLDLTIAPVFYQGEFQSLEHIQSFVGKSKLGGDEGEGVVIKNYSYKNRFGNQQFVKIVSDAFAEKTKTRKQRFSREVDELDDYVDSFLTPARVEKMLHKLVDEDILHEEFGIEDMGIILKNSGGRIAEDILEEEMDELIKIVKRKIGKKYPTAVKDVLETI